MAVKAGRSEAVGTRHGRGLAGFVRPTGGRGIWVDGVQGLKSLATVARPTGEKHAGRDYSGCGKGFPREWVREGILAPASFGGRSQPYDIVPT
jgi:hypothetical protein